MCQSMYLIWKIPVQNAGYVFLPIFVTNTKIIFGYNFVDPLKSTCVKEANIYVFKVNNSVSMVDFEGLFVERRMHVNACAFIVT